MNSGLQPHDDDAPGRPVVGGLAQVSLFVRDLDAAVRFYDETLGLPHLFSAGDLAFHDISGVRLYLHRCGSDDWRPGSILYFSVHDIAATYQALQAAGVKTSGAPHHVHTDEAGTQEWMLFFEDPDGNTLAAVSQVATP